MFIYINLVESYRDNGVVKHKVLYNFGRGDLIKNNKSFINMVKKLCEIAEIGIAAAKEKQIDCSEAEFYCYGYFAYAVLWERLGLRNCIEKINDETKVQFSMNDAAFLMVMQHLLQPRSKLGTYERQERYYGLNDVELHHMYRTLDKLAPSKEKIEDELFFENYTKYGQTVDVVFYDVTTFAFESVIADELKNFGFSKDCKFNEVQVVMGLLMDADGLPVGYELFAGNTFDGKTMIKALENVKRRFGINRVIIVADRGLNSKGNLTLIKEAGYGYIVASKIRAMKKETINDIFNPSGYIETESEKPFKYKILDYVNIYKNEAGETIKLSENLIISFSEKRAAKDRADRNRLIEKAQKLLTHPELIKSSSKRGGKKYLDDVSKSSSEWILNTDKIEEDSKFDGYYGIQTSEKNMSAVEIINAYHSLWKIEESFRIMKSTLEVRPVFHWTPDRIHGHFLICFIAFMLERKMEILLSQADIKFSTEQIKEALNSMQFAKVNMDGEELFIKSKPIPLGNKIWSLLKLTQPANLNSVESLDEIFTLEKKPLWGQLSLF